jgi:hypothetical protein
MLVQVNTFSFVGKVVQLIIVLKILDSSETGQIEQLFTILLKIKSMTCKRRIINNKIIVILNICQFHEIQKLNEWLIEKKEKITCLLKTINGVKEKYFLFLLLNSFSRCKFNEPFT